MLADLYLGRRRVDELSRHYALDRFERLATKGGRSRARVPA
jgi:hypothetical protein